MKLGKEPIKLGVVGSRDYPKLSFVSYVLLLFMDNYAPEDLVIVSGGAVGVDTEAEFFARNNNLAKPIIRKADWTLGKQAGMLRNTDIVNDSDYMISFQFNNSRGTQDSIDKATKAGKYIGNVNSNGDVELTELGKKQFSWLI